MKRIAVSLFLVFLIFSSACSKNEEKPLSLSKRISYKWNWIDVSKETYSEFSAGPVEHITPPPEAYILFESNGNLTIFDGQNLYNHQWLANDANTFTMTFDTQCKIDLLDEHHLTFHFQTVNGNETTVFTWVFEK